MILFSKLEYKYDMRRSVSDTIKKKNRYCKAAAEAVYNRNTKFMRVNCNNSNKYGGKNPTNKYSGGITSIQGCNFYCAI